MNIEELKTLVAGGETSTVELKLNAPRPSDIAIRLCGFANSPLGGILIIGVEDNTWKIKGVTNPAAAIDDLIRGAGLCSPAIPFIDGAPIEVILEGKKLVVARVPPNEGLLYQASGAFWLRRGTVTRPMDTTQVAEYLNRQGLLSWEAQPNNSASLEDLDMGKFENFTRYLAEVAQRPPRVKGNEALLTLLNCATWVTEKSGKRVLCPTNAGLLLFGYSPRYYFPHAEVICTYYKDDSGLRRYDDRRIITGTIDEQIDRTATFLKMYTPVGARVEGFHRVDEPAISLEALREAVVNALVHRDYSLQGEAVRIFYYLDRVEIHNPGLLMPGLTLEELQHGQARSKPRNPVIASILRDMPGNYMERVGTGIPFMFNQMASLGLPPPDFSQHGEFVVTFWRKEARTALTNPVSGNQSEQSQASRSMVSAPKNVDAGGREERLKLALEHVRLNGFISNKDYQKLAGVSENTATRDLEILVERGSLTRTGRGPSRRYTL